MTVPGAERRTGGVGGGPRAEEEIKEEEIFCSYVNQISALHAPRRQKYVEALKEGKGTNVA